MVLRFHTPIGNSPAMQAVEASSIVNIKVELVDAPYDQAKK